MTVAGSATARSSLLITHSSRGQALIEMALGMFALTLVVSALCGFAIYIAKSLKMQNSLRVGDASQHDTVQVSDFAAKYIFGTESVPVREKVEMPGTRIQN